MAKPLRFNALNRKNESGTEGVTSTSRSLEHRHLMRRRPMSRCGQYRDSVTIFNTIFWAREVLQ